MDEFGVLTERFGLKPQGKAAPMAASKQPSSSSNAQSMNFGFDSGLNPIPSSYSSRSSPNSDTITQSFGGFDDFSNYQFGGANKPTKQSDNSFDYDSIFSNSSSSKPSSSPLYVDDDLFGGMPGLKNSATTNGDDVFASFVSQKQSAPIDDLFGNLAGVGEKQKNPSRNTSVESVSDFDDLIPGFGGSSPANNGKWTNQPRQSPLSSTKPAFPSSEDPFVVLESTSGTAHNSSELFSDQLEQLGMLNNSGRSKAGISSTAIPSLRPPPKPRQVSNADKDKSSHMSSIDELENFAMGKVQSNSAKQSDARTSKKELKNSATKSSRYNEAEDASRRNLHKGGDDLESFFSTGSRSSSVPRSRAATLDPIFDAPRNKKGPEVPKRTPSETSAGIKKSPSTSFMVDDLSAIFGAAPLVGEFQEIEGESEERRKARLGRHQRTQERAAQAVADMNKRDLQTQNEQEERHRIAESVDVEVKHWAAGREGNMRALLSSLQNVLWPECGWQPVSLTDIITSTSVKKVYRKATLCIHPDKVQQKGASLKQKYTAEKVFDILKEAWKKFNAEELS